MIARFVAGQRARVFLLRNRRLSADIAFQKLGQPADHQHQLVRKAPQSCVHLGAG